MSARKAEKEKEWKKYTNIKARRLIKKTPLKSTLLSIKHSSSNNVSVSDVNKIVANQKKKVNPE